MRKSKRMLILFLIVEVLLVAIMIGLVWYVKTSALPTTSPEEALVPIRRIGEAMGGVMGALGAFLLIFAWLLRRRGE